jgi:heterodisulfide reductase subunit A
LARILGINLANDGFFGTDNSLNSNETNVDGIFLAGTCQSPKDIPDSVAHGIAAASKAIQRIIGCASQR